MSEYRWEARPPLERGVRECGPSKRERRLGSVCVAARGIQLDPRATCRATLSPQAPLALPTPAQADKRTRCGRDVQRLRRAGFGGEVVADNGARIRSQASLMRIVCVTAN
jgi:hypothetical protein